MEDDAHDHRSQQASYRTNDPHRKDEAIIPRNLVRLGSVAALGVAAAAFLAIGLGGAIQSVSSFGEVGGDALQILVLTFFAIVSLGLIGLGFTLAGNVRSVLDREGGGLQVETLLGLFTGLWIVLGLTLVFAASGDLVGPSLADGILTALAGVFGLIGVLVYRGSLEGKIASGVLALTGVVLLIIGEAAAIGLFVGFNPFDVMDTGLFYAAYLVAIPAAILYVRGEPLRASSGRLVGALALALAGIGGLVEGIAWLDRSPWDDIGFATANTGAEVGAWFQFAGGIAFFVASIATLVVSVLLVIENTPAALRQARTQLDTGGRRAPAGGSPDRHAGGGTAAPGAPSSGEPAQEQNREQQAAPATTATQGPADGDQQGATDTPESEGDADVFCPSCGTELRSGVAFCPQCGDEVPG